MKAANNLNVLMTRLNPLEALATPQLSGLKKAAPEELSNAIAHLLKLTMSRFNFADNKTLDDSQISYLVSSIVTHYWMYKIDEVAYVLREGIAGRLHTFDRLDEAVIMRWFAEYEVKQRDDLLGQHCQAQRSTPKVTKLEQAAMGPVYVLKACHDHALKADQLDAYKDDLAARYPDRPELLAAVDSYAAHLVQAAAKKLEVEAAQRERVRILLARTADQLRRIPNETDFANDPSLTPLVLPPELARKPKTDTHSSYTSDLPFLQ